MLGNRKDYWANLFQRLVSDLKFILVLRHCKGHSYRPVTPQLSYDYARFGLRLIMVASIFVRE